MIMQLSYCMQRVVQEYYSMYAQRASGQANNSGIITINGYAATTHRTPYCKYKKIV